jgi:hypothetical protein
LRDERRLRVLENRVLRRIFGFKRDEVTREWRKLHNEELSDLCSSPNIFRAIKLRIMRLAELVAHKGRGEVYTGFWWRNLREREYVESPGVDGSIILGWIFRKWDEVAWTGLIWLRIESGGGHL